MNKQLLIMLCLQAGYIFAGFNSEFNYSKATALAQEGDWQAAQEKYHSLLVNEPDRPDLLYDAGVSSYRLKQFEQADAYFSSAAAQEQIDPLLKKQTLFNLGNTKVALNQLEKALTQYDAALQIAPDDERIRENQEKVKQMLEQQKQEQQQSDKNKDQQNKDQQKDQGNEEQKGQESADQKQQQKQNQSQKKQKEEQSSAHEQQKEQSSDQKEEGEHEQSTDDESNRQQPDNKQNDLGNNHDSPLQETHHQQQKKDESHHTQKQEKEQAVQSGEERVGDYRQEQLKELEAQLDPNEKWMARVMYQLEKVEEQEQKKLIKASVQKQTGHHGYNQNCW